MSVPPDPQKPDVAWSPELRSWVSLVLFAHLFAVFVAVTTYTHPSALQQQVHGLFAPYLRTLHLTAYGVSYPFARFYLTHETGNDIDFSCEIDVRDRSGKTEKVFIPDDGLWPAVRYRRYQYLANVVGTLAAGGESNEEFSGILPRAIAGGVLRRNDAAQGTFLCRAHYLPEMDTAAKAANDGTVYEAEVFSSPSGIELLKKSGRPEVAPVEKSPQRPSKPQP